MQFSRKIRTIPYRLVSYHRQDGLSYGIMTINHKRILLYTLILVGILWIANVLFAQPQQLPQISLPQISQPQISQPPIAQNPPQQEAGALTMTLTRKSPDELVQALRQTCGHRVTAQSQHQYTFSSSHWNNTPRQSLLHIDTQANRVTLTGDRQLSEQVFHMIVAIDQPVPQGRKRRLIPYQHVHPDVLIRAFDSYRMERPIVRRVPNKTPAGRSNLNVSNVIQQVQFQDGGFFDRGGGFVEPGILSSGTRTPGLIQSGDPAHIGVVDDSMFFKYRMVPAFDVIVIEADGARLAQFEEMIKQLEDLSKISRPKIDVIYLKHVNNVSLGYLVNTQDFLNQFFQTVQGNVRIIPMASPNAMMLCGWGDAMDVAKEIIEALDKPIAVENSRLHFFRLAHISATQAQTLLQRTYPSTLPSNSGFLPRMLFVPDARSNVLIVQAAPNDLAELERVIKEIDVPTSAVTLRMSRIQLKHSLAPELAQTLTAAIGGATDGKFPSLELRIQSPEGQKLVQSGIMSDVSITPDVQSNAIIIKAPEACMEFVEELINLLDSASPEAAIKIFQLDYADAESTRLMLTSLIPSNVEGRPGPQLPGTSEGEALIPIRFAVDVRTNSIVAAGSAEDLLVVEALLANLDQEDSLARINKVHFLKNQKAGPVADTITKFVAAQLEAQDASGVVSGIHHLESASFVIADAESNSLIISATHRYYDKIIELINEIDRTPPQVMINVLIAEVTLSDTEEWGVELGFQDPLLFKRGSGLNFNNPSASLGSNPAAFPGTVGSQLLTNFGAGRVGQETGFSGAVFSANSDWINIMLRMLQEQNRLEVLSSPKITAINNQPSLIHVGQELNIATGGSVNPQTGAIQMNTTPKEIGLALTVTPTISPEGTIMMTVVAKKSKVGPEAEGTVVAIAEGNTVRSPKVDIINVGTAIRAANNQTVVLGGMITRDEQKSRRKIPVLGDIPLAGKFFRYEFDRTRRTELLIILTPQIVQTPEDVERTKQMEMARMSWCLKNVVKIHGDVGAYSVVSPSPYTGNAPVITPGPVRMEELQPLLAPTIPTPTLPRRD